MKKGFTIAETVLTMAILGVIAAVTIPIINDAQPNKDIVMYNKALSTMQTAVGEIINKSFDIAIDADVSVYNPEDFLANIPSKNICMQLAANLNTKGEIKCNQSEAEMSYDSPDFVTTDGLKFWHVGGPDDWFFAGGDGIDDILVDYELTDADKKRRLKARYPNNKNKEWTEADYGLRIGIHKDGKVSIPDEARNNYEKILVENGLKLKVKN